MRIEAPYINTYLCGRNYTILSLKSYRLTWIVYITILVQDLISILVLNIPEYLVYNVNVIGGIKMQNKFIYSCDMFIPINPGSEIKKI